MDSDTFSITCPSCKAQLRAMAQHIGKQARCKRCNHKFTVSRPSEEPQLGSREIEELTARVLSDESIAISYRAVQKEAAQKLVNCGERASPIVSKVLLNTRFKSQSDYHNAAILCEVLGKIGGQDARKTLELLKNADPPVAEFSIVKQAVIKALSEDKPPPATAGASSIPNEEPTDIFQTINKGSLEDIRKVIWANRGCVNARDFADETPLFHAARFGETEVVELLLANGADPNAREKYDGQTPLYWAAYCGKLAAAQALLAHGANANARTNLLKTALLAAKLKGYDDMVEVLRKHGGTE
ncbi:MAG: ankyrin repeat domain-containing protein [Thermoguttaceae bacterium]|jgi:predicted Zn finger-like uncharacterized protein